MMIRPLSGEVNEKPTSHERRTAKPVPANGGLAHDRLGGPPTVYGSPRIAGADAAEADPGGGTRFEASTQSTLRDPSTRGGTTRRGRIKYLPHS